MAMFRKLVYKKPPDGLLEISERVYVFDCCFTTDAWDKQNYKGYMGNVVTQLKDHYPDASILVFNFREGDTTSQLASALSNYEMTIVEYPRHHEGCPLLQMEVIHHFLRSCESWLSLGLQNVLLMHCERGGWPVLAFMLAALLIYRKHYSGESKTLDMVYKQAPIELLHLFSSMNPLPSQLRYLQYVSRRNVATEWPPLDRALSLDCVIVRMIPDVDGNGGFCPIFRIFGQDPYMPGDKTTKLLFLTQRSSRTVRYYKQAECELVIIDIDCHIQGDIVLECISLQDDKVHESIIFRAMFNTSFIRSNILILTGDEIDIPWDAKYQFPNDFKAEFLFSEMNASAPVVSMDSFFFDEKDGLPIEAFAKVQEMFSSADWLAPKNDNAGFNRVNSQSTLLPTSSSHPLNRVNSQSTLLPTNEMQVSGFPPTILPPGFPLKESDTKTGSTSQSIPSPVAPSTPFRENRDTGHKPPHATSSPQTESPSSMNEKGTGAGLPGNLSLSSTSSPRAPPASPPPSPPTPPQQEKVGTPGAPSTPPPRSPTLTTPSSSTPASPVKDKSTTPAEPSPPPPPPPPPPPTAPMTEKPETTAGPSTSPPQPPPPPPPPPPTAAPPPPPPPAPPTPSAPPPPPPPAPPTPSAPPPPPPPAPSNAPPPPPPPFAKGGGPGPPPPPPPAPSANGGGAPPPPPPRGPNASGAPAPPPPLGRGRGSLQTMAKTQQLKKLKPLHWLKLTRAVQGSLWAETQKSGEAVKTPEIDISELENLFSAAIPPDKNAAKSKSAPIANKPEKVQLIDHRRAYNCEIMLSKVKIPLHELMDYVLALDESALDVDQVDNLIKFCPTKEEMEVLKNYKGEKDKLGKCEQFFLELMKVPRTESKLRVFSFKLQFGSQAKDLRKSLNSVNTAVEQVRSSSKFKRVMQTILTLGNALNQGTARGAAVGFRLDSLLKLTDTRARNKRMTLMHYLCKVLVDKLPELLDFSKDLDSLEPASKVQLKYLAEEMQAISKGLEKVVQELSMAENDGPVSEKFLKALKEFLCTAEGEARSLASLYSLVGKNVDALILYFGEDPARCPYEHVVSTLKNFVRTFNQAHDENCKQIEAEKKKAEKEALEEKSKPNDSKTSDEITPKPNDEKSKPSDSKISDEITPKPNDEKSKPSDENSKAIDSEQTKNPPIKTK
ncbi:unnamed protein product [Lactuca virosa]|uniref:Formin-like protein n=1 Tax=Lactuca virosa TaxID=75947 RepID=A0AAU9PGE0_9ASTR|nr:unnamed protein product [Lactuca virosa]